MAGAVGCGMSERLVEMLTCALSAHEVVSRQDGNSVAIDSAGLLFLCNEGQAMQHPNTLIIQVSIGTRAPLLGGRTLWTTFAGVGPDVDAAVLNGFEKFLLCPFHVILSALGGHLCDRDYEEWRTHVAPSGEVWRICDSPLLTQGATAPERVPFSQIQDGIVQAVLRAAPLDVHWVEAFYAYLDGQRRAIDVQFDGEPWAEGAAILSDWAYAPTDGYESGRYFFIAIPQESQAA